MPISAFSSASWNRTCNWSTEMDPAEFHHELMEFPKMLEKPLKKLEGTVKVFKEVHTKMIQAKKGN